MVAKKTDRYTVISTTQSNIPLFQFTTSYIDEKNLKSAVQDYKYVSPTTTILERLFLIKYWNWLATQYPKWLAPNVITLTGFAAFVCPLFVAMYNGYLIGNGETPNWFLLLACVCQFIYQSADGSDGPQARRLKCGSALGDPESCCDAEAAFVAAHLALQLCLGAEARAVRLALAGRLE